MAYAIKSSMTGFYLIGFHKMEPLQVYWEADKKYLADNPDYKGFLLTYGREVHERALKGKSGGITGSK
jgi:hypothetical protein